MAQETPVSMKSRITLKTHSHSSARHQQSASLDRLVYHKKVRSAYLEESPVSATREYISQDYDSPGEPVVDDIAERLTPPIKHGRGSHKQSKSGKLTNASKKQQQTTERSPLQSVGRRKSRSKNRSRSKSRSQL